MDAKMSGLFTGVCINIDKFQGSAHFFCVVFWTHSLHEISAVRKDGRLALCFCSFLGLYPGHFV